jgi:hypothetical protein
MHASVVRAIVGALMSCAQMSACQMDKTIEAQLKK